MNDYHDYVIKDGKLVGEFDKMYADCDDPWFQSKEPLSSYSKWDTIYTIRNFGFKNVLELGCGLGYFTKMMQDFLPDTTITGMDISQNAIKRARKLFPNSSFFVGNVSELGSSIDVSRYDCILFSEIMWYILECLENVICTLKKQYKGGIIVNQYFYYRDQIYGQEFFTNERQMTAFLQLKPIVQNTYRVDLTEDGYETHTVIQL